ncbi:MAG: hypothetical protein KF887_08130 [Paracoccaceae bacterium]|nr:MAG: hypothetical protein KF887_08130 [Paracoccaceae bacterium]
MAGLPGLFDPPPSGWGLRGDPALWSAMREGFAGQPLPNSETVLLAMIAASFRRIAGRGWDTDDPIPVPGLAGPRGGLSNGLVAPRWWRDAGVPTLVARWRAARAALPG